jgi:dTDP-glucose 4,6-dehydratase|tara:strand:+ start:8715 stop:9665 length:951 start_codon:yes stop_codon:yes gene_type:complete
MKIVYITGCLGFMGSYITRKALKRGWMVRGVDKITYAANCDLLKEFGEYENFVFEEQDIKNLDFLYDCDYVINFAAESHVGNSIIDSEEFVNTNVGGVKNLLELIRHKPKNVNDRPILFHISTDEVYGDIVGGAHLETDLLKPSNPYSASKASGDMLINAWARTYGINYIIMRPTNNYGIGQYPEKLIPLSIKNLQRGRNIRLHNNGTPIRNWLHADDTAEAVMTIIDAGIKNEIFNVAGSFEQKNIDAVKKIIKAYFGSLDNWEKHIDFSYTRAGQDVRYSIDDVKIRALGWKPKRNFDKEIVRIVKHYKENFRW